MNTTLPLLIFSPLAGLLVMLFLNSRWTRAIRWTAFLTSLLTFALAVSVTAQYNAQQTGMQLVWNALWIRVGAADITFSLGVDGLGIMMVLLTAFLTPLALLSTWGSDQQGKVKLFNIFFLLLETAMLGVFAAQDLVLFYIFWEFTLIPMYFLIGIWGGARRVYAAVKFILFTMSGSLLMLVGILYLGVQANSFNLGTIYASRESFAAAQTWLFIVFALAFAVKVPLWPLHSWLPDAHVEAPTAGSVLLAGVLLKMGTYGFVRFNLLLFPQASRMMAPVIAILAVIGILYGAMVSYRQRDMKKLVAYSSVSHLGFVMLGIFAFTPQAMTGAVIQMVNHGLSTGALFLLVGMLYERRHTREMAAFGGVWKVMPVMGGMMLFSALSSAGLPGLNGFIGEFMILLGSFSSPILTPWLAGIATLGVILAAIYLLVLFEKVFLGPLTHEENRGLRDMNARELLVLLPLVVVILWIGLYPKFFFSLINPTVENLVSLGLR